MIKTFYFQQMYGTDSFKQILLNKYKILILILVFKKIRNFIIVEFISVYILKLHFKPKL